MLETYFQPQLPINVGVLIEEDSPVILLEEVIQSLDLSKLKSNKKQSGRKPKIPREQLLIILIYAYMEGVYGSRDIADKLSRDVHYMYLAREATVTHQVINTFRSSLKDDIMDDIFRQFILKLYELKELGFESIYIDGTKIEAYANKYTFVWRKTVSKNEAKLQVNVKELLKKLNNDAKCGVQFIYNEDNKITVELMSEIINTLHEYAKKLKIEFKSGKGKRKSQVQRYIEALEDYLIRQSNYDVSNRILEDRNSYSKTDHDATFMRMKDDHMRNGQLKAGYNVQIGIEGGYVVGVDVLNNRNDIIPLFLY